MAGECIIEKGFHLFGVPFCYLGKVFHSEHSEESHFLNVVFLVIPVKTGIQNKHGIHSSLCENNKSVIQCFSLK
jgi:hypothetical protein